MAFACCFDEARELGRRLGVELLAQQVRVAVELAPGGAPLPAGGVGLEHDLARAFVERVERHERARVAQRLLGDLAGESVTCQQRADHKSELAQVQPVRSEPCEAFEARRQAESDVTKDALERGSPFVGQRRFAGAGAHERFDLAQVDDDLGREPVAALDPLDERVGAELAPQSRERHAQVVRGGLLVVDLGPDCLGDLRASGRDAGARECEEQEELEFLAGEAQVTPVDHDAAGEDVHGRRVGRRRAPDPDAPADERFEDAVRTPAGGDRFGRREQFGRFDAARRREQRSRFVRQIPRSEQQRRGVRERLQIRVTAAVGLGRGGCRRTRGFFDRRGVAHAVQVRHRERDRRLEPRVGDERPPARRGEQRGKTALDPRNHHLLDLCHVAREPVVVAVRPREDRAVRRRERHVQRELRFLHPPQRLVDDRDPALVSAASDRLVRVDVVQPQIGKKIGAADRGRLRAQRPSFGEASLKAAQRRDKVSSVARSSAGSRANDSSASPTTVSASSNIAF